MKIIALVKVNDSIGLVLDEMPSLEYTMVGRDIYGTNGVFCDCLFYEQLGYRWQAFAGRKFDIKLSSGEMVHCEGQYWDGIKPTHRNVADGRLIQVTAATLTDLKACYVFCGHKAIEQKYMELLKSYKGIVYDYSDYEMLITKNQYRRKPHKLREVLKTLRRKIRGERFKMSQIEVSKYGQVIYTSTNKTVNNGTE
jgi:hypothetical protein